MENYIVVLERRKDRMSGKDSAQLNNHSIY